ncbi:hypothetical protein H257_14983 [Aphanomyces astaci]|uniref:Uncharacterized protein n=1 Tax=Aphanomyces astaci TaxID=112090 RepID=W4FRV4_APHAT|nr:hypothetical protein H257_14983 [Aphanomyces astaci]ETV69388.1 hypothetical protein H257_14983 [Aphanomyces astaci]|eukprot:XP_009841245.1 hypothetical protein H257_14983 [Aphanomyces astaci]
MMADGAAPSGAKATKKKAKIKPHSIYITERVRYFKKDVPTVDTLAEKAKLEKKLLKARELGLDPNNTDAWKQEAQALTQLGQLEKWKGNEVEGDKYLTECAKLCRMHTFNNKG